jgi:hypothetical protein
LKNYKISDNQKSIILLSLNLRDDMGSLDSVIFCINKCESLVEKEYFDDCIEITKEFNIILFYFIFFIYFILFFLFILFFYFFFLFILFIFFSLI